MSTWYEIPLEIDETVYDQSGSIRLGEANYVYRLLWNTRTARWTFSLWTMQGVALVVGRNLCLTIDVLARCNVTGRPAGQIFVAREDNTLDDFGHLDLGEAVRLWYAEEAT